MLRTSRGIFSLKSVDGRRDVKGSPNYIRISFQAVSNLHRLLGTVAKDERKFRVKFLLYKQLSVYRFVSWRRQHARILGSISESTTVQRPSKGTIKKLTPGACAHPARVGLFTVSHAGDRGCWRAERSKQSKNRS